MSKHNGNGKGIEKHHFENEALRIGDGISIAATSETEGDTPTEVQLYCKVPGAEFASRFTFHNDALLTDFIESLIAYRRLVFPDAPEINVNATLDDTQ